MSIFKIAYWCLVKPYTFTFLDKIGGFLDSSLGGVLTSAVGGLFGAKGASDQNKANAEIASARNAMEVAEAQKSREFSAKESALKRSYDERMSSSAVQRRMKDMKQGGINPILAGKYDASSPSAGIGATAKANAHGYEAKNTMQPLLDNLGTALQLKKISAETQQIKANTGLTDRKKDLTDVPNRLLNLLDNMIQGGTNSPQSYKRKAEEVKNEVVKQIQELKSYATGEKRRQAQKIRNAPGIELKEPERAKSAKQKLKYRDSKKSRSQNRSRGR